MVNKKCDNCGKEDQFNGWKYNQGGVTVFLCGKCSKEDEEFGLTKHIVKTKLEAKNGTS